MNSERTIISVYKTSTSPENVNRLQEVLDNFTKISKYQLNNMVAHWLALQYLMIPHLEEWGVRPLKLVKHSKTRVPKLKSLEQKKHS